MIPVQDLPFRSKRQNEAMRLGSYIRHARCIKGQLMFLPLSLAEQKQVNDLMDLVEARERDWYKRNEPKKGNNVV